MEECNKYSNAELVWVQEEHKNQGGWSYVQPRFQTAIGGYSRRINYCGREVRFLKKKFQNGRLKKTKFFNQHQKQIKCTFSVFCSKLSLRRTA